MRPDRSPANRTAADGPGIAFTQALLPGLASASFADLGQSSWLLHSSRAGSWSAEISCGPESLDPNGGPVTTSSWWMPTQSPPEQGMRCLHLPAAGHLAEAS